MNDEQSENHATPEITKPDAPKPSKPRFTNPLITGGHLSRKAFIYVRQSSLKEKEQNTGSTEYQRQLKQVAASYGWPEHLIELSEEDVGTSSRATERRTGWQRILKEIGEDLVGSVFIVNSSRMARQYEYYADFRKLAARHNVLIFMDDRLINLRDLGDKLYSNMSAFVAEISSLIQTEHMRRSRLAKAQPGTVVSSLPVGWIKRPDKSLDFDPVAKPSIDLVISVFREKRTLHGTVRELLKQGKKLPVKKRAGRIDWLEPSLERVRGMIVNPAYSGTYIYAKTESAPELGLRSNGQAMRKRTRPDDWIVLPDHHQHTSVLRNSKNFYEVSHTRLFLNVIELGAVLRLFRDLWSAPDAGRNYPSDTVASLVISATAALETL